MRKYIVIALVLLIAGVGASLYLIPTDSEIVREQATDTAAIDLGKVDIDAEYAQGRRTFPIINALAERRLAEGNRPAAILLWEEYAKSNTRDAKGQKKLAEQYQLAGRQDDYNRQLEAVAAAEPSEANLRVLSDIYNAGKDYPKQVAVLKKILEVTDGKNPATFVDLATMQLVIGDKDGALVTLEQLKKEHDDFASYPATRILVTVLVEKAQADRAFELANEWINTPVAATEPNATGAVVDSDPRPKELADLCNIFHYGGHADKAVALVDPHIDMLPRSPELIVAYINADVTAGRADHAFALLQKIDEAKRMTPALYPIYIDLTLKRDDTPGAEAIAAKMDVAPFNEEQALNVIELARANNANSVVKVLTQRFGDKKVLEGKPVLAAVIAILENHKDQNKTIDVALKTELSSVQRIRLAEACARAQKTACFDAIIKQFPPIDSMSPAQVAEFAQLYIIANRPEDVIEPIGVLAAKPSAHPDIGTAHRRLAATAGRLDILKPWLEANGNTAPLTSMQELYYLANDHRRTETASDIAERLYARDPSPINRNILTGALVNAGNHERAIVLLRQQVADQGSDDGLYLASLTKLARKNAEYRKELTDYASASLASARGDSRQQLNYTYVLINNGKKDQALPYARKYAAERGGEWKKMLAGLTQKPGKGGTAVALTREQRLALAASPSISDANKRDIAFSLLNDGFKPDATKIFEQLAAKKGPDSQEVKDLLYLWGGKLNDDQLSWVRTRAASASAYDKDRWAELVNNNADDEAILRYVGTTPDALYHKPLRQKYFSILGKTNRENYDTAMRGWVSQTTDVPALMDYATTAQAFGYQEAAAGGYNRVIALEPNNSKALSQVAALQFAKGKFSDAERNLTQYTASKAQAPEATADSAQAHFYKGELLRRNGNKAGADAEYQQVVDMTVASGTRAPDALSRFYTALFRLGRHEEAKAGFDRLLADNPNDKGILADYMSALIEYRYLSEASRVANQYDKTSPYYNKGSSLQGRSPDVSSVQPVSDITTVSPRPGIIVRIIPTAGEYVVAEATPLDAYGQPQVVPQQQAIPAQQPYAEPSQEAETQRQQDIRLQLLYARIEQESGQTARAKERIGILKQYYPNDPQILSYEASLASADGNQAVALSLLQQAQTLSPENEDYARMERDLKRTSTGSTVRGKRAATPQYVKLDHEYRNYGSWHENITSLSALKSLGNGWEIGANLMTDALNPKLAANPGDGRPDDHSVDRQATEIYAGYYLENGDRLQGSFFTSGDYWGGEDAYYGDETLLGFGAYYAFTNPLGRTELLGEYNKPYWDFPEAVYAFATRDRIGAKHYRDISKRWSLGLEASYNNYNVDIDDSDDWELNNAPANGGDDGESIAQTALIRLSTIYALQQQSETRPFLGVGYGFDGEYLTSDIETRFAYQIPFNGATFEPFPFRSRENHQLTGIYRDDWTTSTHVYFAAGYLVDRLGENGPVVEGRLTQDLSKKWELGIRGRYGLATSANGSANEDDAVNLGAHLMYKF